MLTKFILLLLFLFAATNQQANKIGFAYVPNPDVIRCGNYFYYLMKTSSGTSVYNAFTGFPDKIESYDVKDGIVQNKKGYKFPNNCNGNSIE